MDSKTLKDNVIMPKLVESFGADAARQILTLGTAAGFAAVDDAGRAKAIVETICSDKRVVAMWGTALAEKRKQEWLSA